MADNFTELKKSLSNAQGNVSVDGTRLGYSFYTVPSSVTVAVDGFITVEDVKSGAAKAALIKQAKNSIRIQQNVIDDLNKQIAEDQAVLADPNSSPIQKKGAERRIAENKDELTRNQQELNGAQSVLAYGEGGFQSDLDSLVGKAEAEIKAQQAATEPEPTTEPEAKPEEPAAPDAKSKTKENQVDEDATPPATPGANQAPPVVATPGKTTTTSSAGTGTGAAASPGPSGTGSSKAAENPGKRLYNPLSKLASYTYNFTLYMITPDAYEAFVLSGRKKIDALGDTGGGGGAFIIAQSGGVNSNTQNRAPGFELDYYIDNVKFTTPTSGKESGTVAFYQFMSFTITEPYGFSFLTNLKKAREALQQYSNQTTYKDCTNNFAQFFIMGIRFYGYDINGNLIKPGDTLFDSVIDPTTGGSQALFESFYDLSLQDIKFQVNGKTTQYTIQASSLGGQAGLGTKRGRITTGAKLRGSTVHEMLVGPYGLLTKLNKEQQDKVKKNPQDQMFANEYDVLYLDDAYDTIGKASMVLASDLSKYRLPGSSANSTVEATDAIGIKAIPDYTQRELVFNNDTSIIQAITGIVTKSTFMENALKTVYNNVVQPNPSQKSIEQTQKNNPTKLSWINVSTEISKPRWDPIVSDWAYKITYVIQRYEIPSVNSGYSNQGAQYYGPHKRYMYYLTGQNSEVLDFVLNFNLAYQNVVLASPSANQPTTGAGSQPPTSGSTAGGTFPAQAGVRQNADTTGSLSTSQEAQNSIVTDLTSPDAYIGCKIKILGDPDFLVRDQTSSVSEVYKRFYGVDGFSISPNGGQVYIEIGLNEGVDYKNQNGLFEINEEILFLKYPKHVKEISKGIIFLVREVNSTFTNGRFEQELILDLATSFVDKNESAATAEKDAASREANIDQLQEVQVSGKRNAGGAVGNDKATVSNTGQTTDPQVVKPELSGSSPQTSQTTGTSSPQTVTTKTGPVADDDALQEVQVTGRKTTAAPSTKDAGRDPSTNLAFLSDGELFALGYTTDEIEKIRRGETVGP